MESKKHITKLLSQIDSAGRLRKSQASVHAVSNIRNSEHKHSKGLLLLSELV